MGVISLQTMVNMPCPNSNSNSCCQILIKLTENVYGQNISNKFYNHPYKKNDRLDTALRKGGIL